MSIPSPTQAHILALQCDKQGIIQCVLQDTLAITNQTTPGRLWVSLLASNSLTNALDFFQTILQDQHTSKWEFDILAGETAKTAQFTGFCTTENVFIFSTIPLYNPKQHGKEKEESAFPENQPIFLKTASEQEAAFYDELTKINNELITTQRELTRKNIEFEKQKLLVQRILDASPDILYLYDLGTQKCAFFNQNIKTILGLMPTEPQPGKINLLNLPVHPEDSPVVTAHLEQLSTSGTTQVSGIDYRVQNKENQWRWINCRDTIFERDPQGIPITILGIARDITDRKIAFEKIEVMSSHDSLTGLYNRAYFENTMGQLENSDQYPISLIIIDINDLKKVNDTLGHITGDELLKRTAVLLREIFRSNDVIVRLGGDEFAIILSKTPASTEAVFSSRIKKYLNDYNQNNKDLPIHFAAGFATAENKNCFNNLFKQADQRMYTNKMAYKKISE